MNLVPAPMMEGVTDVSFWHVAQKLFVNNTYVHRKVLKATMFVISHAGPW